MRRVAFILAILLLVPVAAHAQNVNVIDQIVSQFQTAMAGWGGRLQAVAMDLFGILAIIQFAWALIRLALRRADLSEILAELVTQIIFIGLFYWLLTTTTLWAPAIINSFRQAAGIAGGMAVLTPGDVFKAGLNIGSLILSQISMWSPSATAGLIVAGICVMLCFGFITATMVLVLVDSYFIASTAVLFMGFGGSSWTQEIAVAVVRQTLGIGARLFALQLVVSIGMTFIQQWSASFNNVTSTSMLIEIGQAFVLAVLCKMIPDRAQSIVGGASFAHGGALIGTAAGAVGATMIAGRVAAGVATSLAGAGAAAYGAANLASTQMARRSARGTAPGSTMGRVATTVGLAGKNLASGVGRDIGRRLSGQNTTGFRVAGDLQQQEEELRANTPSLPQRTRRGP
jgi:type IV secretion system protein TrbL